MAITSQRTMKERMRDMVLVLIGTFILAASSHFFVLPYEILSGGVAGISIVLSTLFGLSSELWIDILTVSLFLLGAFVLGKQFALRTIISTIFYPLFLIVLKYVPIVEGLDVLLVTVYAGLLMGAGVGLVFRTGASTGGMDIPPLIVHKYTNIDLSKLVLITDALTVLVGAMVFGVEKALIGLVSVYISSIAIDKMLMLGGMESKSIYIVSQEWEAIKDDIQNTMNRGTTILKGTGGFTGDDRPVIMTIVSKKEYPLVQRIVDEHDMRAFVVVSNATEVHGEGFTYESLDEY